MTKVSIVIPNWNGAEKLRRHLPNVLKVKDVFEIIVSDDASTDNSLQVLAEEFPEVKVVVRKTNGGFATNVNTGFSHATGDFVFLLNSDASPEPDCVEKVLPHFKDPRVFSVSCSTGGNWVWAKWENGYFWHNQAILRQAQDKQEVHETLWASGGGSLFRKSIWDKLEGMDELFSPFYEEDVDLGYRARKRGFINLFDPNAKVEHYKEKGVIALNFTQKTISNTAQRNQLLFTWKNITDAEMIQEHTRALWKMILSHPKYVFIFWEAYTLWPEMKKKHEVEMNAEIISDKEILAKFADFR